MKWDAAGLVCEIEAPLERLRRTDVVDAAGYLKPRAGAASSPGSRPVDEA